MPTLKKLIHLTTCCRIKSIKFYISVMKKFILLLLFVPIVSLAQNQDYKASENPQLYVTGVKLQDIDAKYVSLKFGAPMMKVSKWDLMQVGYAQLNWGQDKLLDNKGKVNDWWNVSFAQVPSKRSRVYFNDISQFSSFR